MKAISQDFVQFGSTPKNTQKTVRKAGQHFLDILNTSVSLAGKPPEQLKEHLIRETAATTILGWPIIQGICNAIKNIRKK